MYLESPLLSTMENRDKENTLREKDQQCEEMQKSGVFLCQR